ncbi:hypothetical protein DFH09DRAFT_1100099 [Mycena vulgaris]|nr:hypothetical protein DFH09DRAFT_1100099 [Mycena vulgaris]
MIGCPNRDTHTIFDFRDPEFILLASCGAPGGIYCSFATPSYYMIGRIHLPFHMKPDDPNHQNPTLSSIFDAAADWIRTLGLVPTPELEAILSAPLISLMVHPGLSDISEHECHTRVMGVGSVLLQLLAVQHKLKEPLDLNGDLIEDLLDNSVVPGRSDGDDAFNVMFAALESSPAESGVLVQQMLKFKRDHTVFDEEFQPPTFRRDRPSHIQPNIAIPVVVGGRNIESVRLGVFGAPSRQRGAQGVWLWCKRAQVTPRRKPRPPRPPSQIQTPLSGPSHFCKPIGLLSVQWIRSSHKEQRRRTTVNVAVGKHKWELLLPALSEIGISFVFRPGISVAEIREAREKPSMNQGR